MSSMLDQAIVDAQALREAALKNAEQAVIDKYAPEIKAAVNSLLEGDDKEVITEQEEPAMDASAQSGYEIPFASDPGAGDAPVEMTMEFEFDPEDFHLDLEDLKTAAEQVPGEPEAKEGTEALAGSLGLESPDEGGGMEAADEGGDLDLGALEENLQEDDDEALLNELMDLLEEEDNIEEALKVDTAQQKHGHFVTDAAARKYDEELELAGKQSTEYKEYSDELEKEVEDLKNTILSYQSTQDKLHGTIADMKAKIEEALVMNARLLYSNRILSDASLNERQKTKIVEAIAQAETIKEAKTICETLKETIVGTATKGPKSLSESVNRRSNLSHVLPRRKQQKLNETLDFASRMRKLAGIDDN